MLAGNPTAWGDRFRSFDARFLERVTAVWRLSTDGLPKHPDEDTITINLVDLLKSDPDVLRRFHWIEFQYEPFGHTAEGTAYSTGSVDMAVFLNQDRDIYLAYECKRLNDVRKDGRRSLASRYVKDGLCRFVVEQYAEGLPVACMLGYVLDGDMDYAESSVRGRIVELARGSRPRHRTAGRSSHRRVETLLQPPSPTVRQRGGDSTCPASDRTRSGSGRTGPEEAKAT